LPARLLLCSNRPKPKEIPETPNISWLVVEGKSERWWSYVAFPLAARRIGASAIHTQYALSPLVGDKGITTIHDVSFFIGPEWFRPKDRFLLQRSVPAAVRRARTVLAVSETDKSEIERYMPAAVGKTHVTYNACPDWIQWTDRDEARSIVRAKLGLEGPYLLTVGTRWPRKNMDLAIRACDLLPGSLPHMLVITGKAGWGGSAGSGRTRFTGYVDDELMGALYAAATLYLAPSRHEGFGIPLLEAFRCGCPVLCSSGGALPEIAGAGAAVENSWSPEDWSERIQGLLGDSSNLEALRKAGFRREKEFTWEETARRTLDAYLGATA
jgi:glycosyltransferase involved in cell wall biosynthesis